MFQIISLTLPALFSGLALIVVIKKKYLKKLDLPIDHKFKFNGVRFFGDNKTYRGFVVFVVISIILSIILHVGYQNGFSRFIHPIFEKNPILIGLIYSLSYTIGELTNSAIKRQLHIAPGKTIKSEFKTLQKFFDLSDGILFIAFAFYVFSLVSVFQIIAAAIIGIGLHYATDILMQYLDLKKGH